MKSCRTLRNQKEVTAQLRKELGFVVLDLKKLQNDIVKSLLLNPKKIRLLLKLLIIQPVKKEVLEEKAKEKAEVNKLELFLSNLFL